MVRAIVWQGERSDQSGAFATDAARPVVRPKLIPLGRHEDLTGFELAHWTVIGGGRRGYWLARCECCGNEQEVRLDRGVLYVPVCLDCGAREPRVCVQAARLKFFARRKGLLSQP